MNETSSGMYVVDSECNVVNFNHVAAKMYPQLEIGGKCHKELMGLDNPCDNCPIKLGVKGPKVYLDPIRKIYESVDAIELETQENGVCHALVFSTVGEHEKIAETVPAADNELVQLGVIHALTSNFDDVYGWNVDTDQITIYRMKNTDADYRQAVKNQLGLDAAINMYIDGRVYDEDQNGMKKTFTKENLLKELSEKERFNIHYRVQNDNEIHYYYASVVRIGSADSIHNIIVAFANEDNDVRRNIASKLMIPGNPHSKRRILVVEDKEYNRETLKDILSDEYDILTAENGKEGLKLLQDNFRNLSLIILDVHMPIMDGFEFLNIIKDDDFLSAVPVMVSTSIHHIDDEKQALNLGAVDFVTKPYNAEIIQRRIGNIIKLNESRATLSALEFDELTGLYTRKSFYHHCDSMLKRNPSVKYDMFICDVEDFKRINEHYGEAIGDEVLKNIGYHLDSLNSEDIIVTRFGSDEFIVIVRHGEFFTDEMLNSFERILGDLSKKMNNTSPVDDIVYKYAVYTNIDSSEPTSVLCDRLVQSVKTVKHQYQRGVALYNHRIQQMIERERKIEEYMEEALKNGQFKVYYQPKHDTITSELVGAEALVRWIHPEYGFMSPAEFIPIFERNGFISRLDLYMFEQVCKDIREWIDKGLKVVPVSINASRRDFLVIKHLTTLLNPVLENNISPDLLHIEVTESLYIEDEKNVVNKLKRIKEGGFKIELDDFGSGYSSLVLLKKLPLDIVKLDISFIKDIENQKEVVSSMITLFHSLGLKVIAEGVETLEQMDALNVLGCDYIQGYFYSKPLPKEGFETYLKDYSI